MKRRIFTHLKLWIASARHNFKWVKIPIIPCFIETYSKEKKVSYPVLTFVYSKVLGMFNFFTNAPKNFSGPHRWVDVLSP